MLSIPKARIIARLMADGSINKSRHNYRIRYEVKDEESLKNFEKDIYLVYGLKMTRGLNPSGKTNEWIPFVNLYSKKVYEDLLRYGNYRSYNWSLPNQIKKSSNKIKTEFLRAFYDDEGSVICNNKTNSIEIRLYSINKKGLLQLKSLLEKFGIYSRLAKGYGLKRNVFAIVVNRKKEVKKFSKLIGFNLKRKQEKLIQGLNNKL